MYFEDWNLTFLYSGIGYTRSTRYPIEFEFCSHIRVWVWGHNEVSGMSIERVPSRCPCSPVTHLWQVWYTMFLSSQHTRNKKILLQICLLFHLSLFLLQILKTTLNILWTKETYKGKYFKKLNENKQHKTSRILSKSLKFPRKETYENKFYFFKKAYVANPKTHSMDECSGHEKSPWSCSSPYPAKVSWTKN